MNSDELKVYIPGAGPKGRDSKLVAIRNEKPGVVAGNPYTIENVVDDGGGCGARNLLIKLRDVEGLYSRRTFKAL